MNVTRVTVLGQAAQSIRNVQSSAAALAATQNVLSSGKRIQTSSDDPNGTVTAMGLRSALSRSDQYTSASSDAMAWLSTQDSAYTQSTAVLQSARTLVVQALNSGANDSTSNQALASQLDGLRSTLVSLANTSYNGRPVFGGTSASSTAYDSSGTYLGDNGTVQRVIAPSTTVTIASTGPAVFGSTATGDSIFDTLSKLADTLRTSPNSLSSSSLNDLDAALSKVSTAQSTEGATYQQVQRVTTARTSSDSALTERLGAIENTDYADAAIKTSAANLAYQAALQTTALVGKQSLLNFLN